MADKLILPALPFTMWQKAGQIKQNRQETVKGVANAAQEHIKKVTNAKDEPLKGINSTAEAAFDKSQMSAQQAMAFEASQAAQMMQFQREMLQNQMNYNSAQATEQRAWQEKMRATAYQATVKDMIAAGINPILAAQLGATSAGTGATASAATAAGAMGRGHATVMQQQDVPGIVRTVGYGVASAKKAGEALNSGLKKIADEATNHWAYQIIKSLKR